MLAVKVNYATSLATIGTERGHPVPTESILDAIKSIGYSAKVEQ